MARERRHDGRRGRHRWILAAVTVAVGAIGVTESRWHAVGFAFSDRVVDNVPQYAACDDYATPARAQAVLTAFPVPAAIDAQVTDRCDGRAGIEFQYASHDLREQLESVLIEQTHWVTGAGWSLRGIPVELRNV